MKKIFLIFFISIKIFSQPVHVRTGADIFFEQKLNLIENKNVGIITNHTAILSNGNHLVDEILSLGNVKINALFSPEHGIRGSNFAGEKISNSIDEKTGIPIFSLYGENKKPSKEMLSGIDVLIFDIQDVGARFYTYLSTLILSMEAAAENNILFIVLDRPNPIRGNKPNGPILVDSLKSFVGILPIPIMHGMTFGELALMANEKNWLQNNLKVELEIIELKNWRRAVWFDETTLNWISPSPNIKTINSAITYPGICLFEGTNISEGRGTETPFEIIGSPWLKSNEIISNLKKLKLQGVVFKSENFTPVENFGSKNPKYKNELCNGIKIEVIDRNVFDPILVAIALLVEIKKSNSDEFLFKEKTFDLLSGMPQIRFGIEKGLTHKQIINLWQKNLKNFSIERKKYLIYTD